MDRFLIRLTLVISIILLVASAMWWFLGNHAIVRLFDLILFCGVLSFCLGCMTLFAGNSQWNQYGGSGYGFIVGVKDNQNQNRTRMNYPYGLLLFMSGLIILVGSAIRFLFVYYS